MAIKATSSSHFEPAESKELPPDADQLVVELTQSSPSPLSPQRLRLCYPALCHRLSSLMWTVHLRQRFDSAAELFEKVGKIPKECLCRQNTGMSNLEMPLFFNMCVDFLDVFMEATMGAAQATLDMNRCEDPWKCEGSGPPSLVELAVVQSAANYDLLHLHHQLAVALHMMASFILRFPHPISSLFDNVGQAALFADLTSQPQLPGHNLEQAVIDSRTNFLCRVITEAVQTIQKMEWAENGQDDKVTKLDGKLADQWMSKCLNLASVWQVSTDTLYRHQISELYSKDCDPLAVEIMPAAQDSSQLTSQLLIV
ncbi:rab3 GTPase-activating protein non-catalytic subunit-like [Zootermopsis nevadensis]|uniref:rab3 GTPase-activating protein non-catalytic subunit-like n=1 Tax=Zootermopsis nevadensis TaxID=136037 RepID=UPI000B8ED422|nr:rab3 GTPase-activating protein non-catalytic subunit-like [Zootermopsis nevadensis]